MANKDLKVFHIRIEKENHKQAKIAAAQEGISLQEWVEQALKEKLEKVSVYE